VRRVVALFVKKGEACEWSAKKGEWKRLDPEETFSDPTLARPLRVRELLDAAEADNAVARALLAKKNPVFAQILAEGEKKGLAEGEKKGLAEGEKKGLAEGEKKGLRHAIEIACERLGLELTAERRARINELDAPGLEALLAHLLAERRFP
jgi:flagellar biosynthesis/type III secretory pathway protein FliH